MPNAPKILNRNQNTRSADLVTGNGALFAEKGVNVGKKRVNNKPYRADKDADAVLILEDGSVFWGKGAGYVGNAVGELCFNTSMSGYQEVLSDPSYAGQIINFTFPHIGNAGTNIDDNETHRSFALGMICCGEITPASNYRDDQDFVQWLQQHKLIAIMGLDTRELTHKIRNQGAPRALIAYVPQKNAQRQKLSARFNIPRLLAKIHKWQGLTGLDLAVKVTCNKSYRWQELLYSFDERAKNMASNVHPQYQKAEWAHIVAIDYGIKHNILRHLAGLNTKITVVPAKYSAKKIMALAPDGIFLSNGPGDPAATAIYSTPIIKALLKKNIPIFGICIGHQLLSLALGAQTQKMAIGHRGANHPVKNLQTLAVEITSQNHGFAVLKETLPANVEITHISLFDQSLEGIALVNKPVFAVQYHPEASPGPHDSHYLFQQFSQMIANHMQKNQQATHEIKAEI